jgi:hypothetical protein
MKMYYQIFIIMVFFIINIFGHNMQKNCKDCKNCKWFIKDFKNNNNLGLCKIYSTSIIKNNDKKLIYNFAKNCRNDEFLCGKNGWSYEDLNEDLNQDLTINNNLLYDDSLYHILIQNDGYINLLNTSQIEQIELNTEKFFTQNNIFFDYLRNDKITQIDKDI